MKEANPGGVPHDPQQGEEGHSHDVTADAEDGSNDLEQQTLQGEYRRAYLQQLRRMSCPGCGESEPGDLM